MNKYSCLFPFEKVPFGAKILIYGAGVLGQDYREQLALTNYCKLVGFVDKNYEKYSSQAIPVYAADKIGEIDFEYIVIAVRVKTWLNEVKRVLFSQGVAEDRLIYAVEREQVPPLALCAHAQDTGITYSFRKQGTSMALMLAGGLGDMIVQKRWVMELVSLAPDCLIDLYCVRDEDFLRWLYIDVPNIQNVIVDLGVRYLAQQEHYTFSISIHGVAILQVDNLRKLSSDHDCIKLAGKIAALQKKCQKEALRITMPLAVAFYRSKFLREDCYTHFNFGNVFSIRDRKVAIPLLPEAAAEFARLGLGSYITINTGNGCCKDQRLIAKSWPTARFAQVIRCFKETYPRICVVQVGESDTEKLPGADRYLLGEGFPLLSCVLKQAIFHLDIEGGLVHLASQLGTKCMVLFGPTPVDYYGYKDNINISAGACQGCYGLYEDVNRCARSLPEPECMYAITPALVMEKINTYMADSEAVK